MQALEKIERWIYENIDLSYKLDQLDDLINELIEQIHTPKQSNQIPFTWPVPENMQVVTRDGREVTQLVKFECTSPYPFNGIIKGEENNVSNWAKNGEYLELRQGDKGDLFLREKSPEMIEAWYCEPINGYKFVTLDEGHAHRWSDIATVTKITFHKPTKSDI